jgi:hypothetical protein
VLASKTLSANDRLRGECACTMRGRDSFLQLNTEQEMSKESSDTFNTKMLGGSACEAKWYWAKATFARDSPPEVFCGVKRSGGNRTP